MAEGAEAVSLWNSLSAGSASAVRARDRVSATVRFFPGACEIVKLYLIIQSWKCWSPRGNWSRHFFGPNNGTSDLFQYGSGGPGGSLTNFHMQARA